MSTFVLKIIAAAAMLIDHIGLVLISPTKYPYVFLVLRGIGRLSLPLFLFLIVEGFYHTSNFRNYMKRLGIFALISELPFDLALYKFRFESDFFTDFGQIFADGFNGSKLIDLIGRLFQYQNVFLTLFLGLMLLQLMNKNEKNSSAVAVNVYNGLLTIAFCILASFLRADYSIAGILTLVALYLFRGNKVLVGLGLFIVNGTIVGNVASDNLLAVIPALATLAIIPIAFYNGKKGKDMKYFFYIFYPLHLLFLFIISILI